MEHKIFIKEVEESNLVLKPYFDTMDQLSFCLMDEVAPYFNSEPITHLCALIDEKAQNGLKYNDLKQQLLTFLSSAADLNNPSDSYNIYRKAYEFAKYY